MTACYMNKTCKYAHSEWLLATRTKRVSMRTLNDCLLHEPHFNVKHLCILSHSKCVFSAVLTSSNLDTLVFTNRDGMCLLWGTNWICIYSLFYESYRGGHGVWRRQRNKCVHWHPELVFSWMGCRTVHDQNKRYWRFGNSPALRAVQFFLSHGSTAPVGQDLLIVQVSRSHSARRTTLGRTTLDERSARRRDLYLTTHNSHNRQTSMPPAAFEPTIPVSERPQTHALAARPLGSAYGLIPLWNMLQLTQLITHYVWGT
jgi:hypothetical protein